MMMVGSLFSTPGKFMSLTYLSGMAHTYIVRLTEDDPLQLNSYISNRAAGALHLVCACVRNERRGESSPRDEDSAVLLCHC